MKTDYDLLKLVLSLNPEPEVDLQYSDRHIENRYDVIPSAVGCSMSMKFDRPAQNDKMSKSKFLIWLPFVIATGSTMSMANVRQPVRTPACQSTCPYRCAPPPPTVRA